MLDLETLTVKGLLAWAKTRFPDFDYWSLSIGEVKDRLFDGSRVYGVMAGHDAAPRWVVAYWVVGGSEGYYVHVDRLYQDGTRQMVILGKTFLAARAMRAAARLNAVLQGVVPMLETTIGGEG